MMRRFREHAVLVLALTLLPAACDGDSGVGTDTGKVSILLTDAAGDFRSAVVTIAEVSLQGDGGTTVLMDEEVTTDLLTLANDVATLVEEAPVPAGRYTQLRFLITGGYIEVEDEDGSTRIYASPDYEHVPAGATVAGTLHMPSYGTSGLKVNLPGGGINVDGEERVLLVDFDVSQSFGREAGNSGRWVMTPVVKATAFELSGSVVASVQLADTVELPEIGGEPLTLGAFKARLTNEAGGVEELDLADADGDGVFEAEFRYLIPGKFTLELVAPEGIAVATDVDLPLEVEVGSGEKETVAITVTAVATE
jgi:predicted small secreted protein